MISLMCVIYKTKQNKLIEKGIRLAVTRGRRLGKGELEEGEKGPKMQRKERSQGCL